MERRARGQPKDLYMQCTLLPYIIGLAVDKRRRNFSKVIYAWPAAVAPLFRACGSFDYSLGAGLAVTMLQVHFPPCGAPYIYKMQFGPIHAFVK